MFISHSVFIIKHSTGMAVEFFNCFVFVDIFHAIKFILLKIKKNFYSFKMYPFAFIFLLFLHQR